MKKLHSCFIVLQAFSRLAVACSACRRDVTTTPRIVSRAKGATTLEPRANALGNRPKQLSLALKGQNSADTPRPNLPKPSGSCERAPLLPGRRVGGWRALRRQRDVLSACREPLRRRSGQAKARMVKLRRGIRRLTETNAAAKERKERKTRGVWSRRHRAQPRSVKRNVESRGDARWRDESTESGGCGTEWPQRSRRSQRAASPSCLRGLV
jgi:hypothetical protein